MAFLHKFGLKNFRVFENQTDFEFAPITVLTGTNSSGKSSLIKALLLLQQSFKGKTKRIDLDKQKDKENEVINTFPEIDELDFTTAKHKLASFENTLTDKSKSDLLSFKIPLSLGYGEASYAILKYKRIARKSSNNGTLDSISVFTTNKEIKLFEFIRKDEDGWEINVNYTYFRKKSDEIAKKMLSENRVTPEEIESKAERWRELKNKKKEESLTKAERKEINKLIKEIDEYHNKELKWDYNKQFTENRIIEDNLADTYDEVIDVNLEKYTPNRTFLPLPTFFEVFSKQEFIKQIDNSKIEVWQWLIEKNSLSFTAEATPENIYNFLQKNFQKVNERIEQKLKSRGYSYETDKEYRQALIKGECELMENKLNKKTHTIEKSRKQFIELLNIDQNTFAAFLCDFHDYVDNFFSKVISKEPYNRELFHDDKTNKDLYIETLSMFYEIMKKDSDLETCYNYFSMIPDIRLKKNDSFGSFMSELFLNRIPAAFHNSLETLNSAHYVEGVRATNERVYSYKSQGTGINELLHQFESLNLQQGSPEILFLKEWIKKFNIGREVQVFQHPEGFGTQIKIDNKSLADVGYGVSQFLPILMNIILRAYKNIGEYDHSWKEAWGITGYHSNTMIIEEPETNLHPRLQSQLAELFVDAAKKFHIQFILETHSEYLIRKLQYLTAQKKSDYHIKPEHSVIYYFNDPKNMQDEKEHVRKIKIKENGILDGNFGSGFMDEASTLIKDIYQLSTSN